MRMAGGSYLVAREGGDRVWAFRFADLDGKRAQREFAGVTRAGDVPTLSSARNGSAQADLDGRALCRKFG